MFFAISKILGFFATPSNAVAVLCVLGPILMLMRWQRMGRSILALGIVLLLVFGYSPLSNVLLLTLSERFPAWQENGRAPDGIIVLGGAIDPDVTAARGSLELGSSAERVTAMLSLRVAIQPHVLCLPAAAEISSIIRSQRHQSQASCSRTLVSHQGVSLWKVRHGQRTKMQRFPMPLLIPNQVNDRILVTSAYHMPRAMGVFRRVGFDVEAYPVDWGTRGWSDAWTPFAQLSMGLARTDTAMHEWAGLVAYWLTGHSKELLPGPR